MITNLFISPHPHLQPFVSNYVLSTSRGINTTFSSQWAASNEISFIFYLGNLPDHKNGHGDTRLNGKRNCFVGLSTRYNGIIDFNGAYHTFIIQFELNGVNKIFGLTMLQFTNKIYCAEDVFGKKVKELHEQLANAANIQQMAQFADACLLHFLNLHSKRFLQQDYTRSISEVFNNKNTLLSVTDCANMINMTVKSFERKFLEQTGVFPKMYMRLLRFNEAIKIKTLHPSKSFTSIAYECGYYDQMHFIKDFKQFTALNPGYFFSQSKISGRPRIDIKQAPGSIFKQLNNQLLNEEFVSVPRAN